ncbi:MAG: propionyl-CoA carboxylase [Alphaproteobacteria bacterium]|nr:propionyl-CoA carboxylase [Alphaproteobacteria bacterium]
MARMDLRPLGVAVDELLGEAVRDENAAHMAVLDGALAEKLAVVQAGWGQKYADRVHQKGKLTTWERIDLLKDAGSAVRPFGSLVNWGRAFKGSRRLAPGAGVVTAFVRVCDRWTIVIANDNTIASGAWWPKTPEKIQRAQELAQRLRLPVIYLVDCSGLFLPEQANSFSGRTGAGFIFKRNALLSAEGVPQIAGVFGDCIAGGGYMPIISDRVYMTEQAYMVIAGAALIKGAKSQALTSLDIGGPEVHVGQSGCADVRVPDDPTCIAAIRREIERLPTTAVAFYRHGQRPTPPRLPPAELPQLFPVNHRHTYDVREVIARLVDGSLFHEVLPHTGQEIIVGVARVQGLWVGILANNQAPTDHPTQPGAKRAGGILYRDGIAKLAAFSRACDADGLTMIWLQDIGGFDIGVEAEARGLLGYGSSLIYTNSTNQTPMFTVLLRKASGAGYYAMAGHPYDPVLQLSTPITRQAVMEGRTLAIATYNSKLDDNFEIATQDPAERAEIEQGMTETAARIEADMDPVASASRMDTDEIVPVAELRAWLEVVVEAAYQSIGYRRVKNPRIWALHDLEALSPRVRDVVDARAVPAALTAVLDPDEQLLAPTVGTWRPALAEGALVGEGTLLGTIERVGEPLRVLAPEGVHGVATELRAGPAPVQRGERLLALDEPAAGAGAAVQRAAAGRSEGLLGLRAPMSGTVWRSPAPNDPPFVRPGDTVERRATIGLLEVMKTFMPLLAPEHCVLERWAVEDGGAVDADQPIAWLRPISDILDEP